jgi:hypothetical protein
VGWRKSLGAARSAKRLYEIEEATLLTGKEQAKSVAPEYGVGGNR